ncbi:hypothetical protein H8957_002583 [Semnopithecus entellus]
MAVSSMMLLGTAPSEHKEERRGGTRLPSSLLKLDLLDHWDFKPLEPRSLAASSVLMQREISIHGRWLLLENAKKFAQEMEAELTNGILAMETIPQLFSLLLLAAIPVNRSFPEPTEKKGVGEVVKIVGGLGFAATAQKGNSWQQAMQQKKAMLAADWLLWVTTRGLYFPSSTCPTGLSVQALGYSSRGFSRAGQGLGPWKLVLTQQLSEGGDPTSPVGRALTTESRKPRTEAESQSQRGWGTPTTERRLRNPSETTLWVLLHLDRMSQLQGRGLPLKGIFVRRVEPFVERDLIQEG